MLAKQKKEEEKKRENAKIYSDTRRCVWMSFTYTEHHHLEEMLSVFQMIISMCNIDDSDEGGGVLHLIF